MRSRLLVCALLGVAALALTHCVGDDPTPSSSDPGDSGGGGLAETGSAVDSSTPGQDSSLPGTDSSTKDAGVDSADAAPHPLVAFVTTEKYNGTLDPVGGPAGAGGLVAGDARCNALAAGPYPGRTFKAWLATSATSATARVGAGPFYTQQGTLIGGTTELTNGTLKTTLNYTQSGLALTTSDVAWTGTNDDGTYATNSTCADWTSILGTDTGGVGTVAGGATTWTHAGDLSCNTLRRLYCFEQ